MDEDLGGKIGLKKLGDRARGLLTEKGEDEDDGELGVGRHAAKRNERRGRAGDSQKEDIWKAN